MNGPGRRREGETGLTFLREVGCTGLMVLTDASCFAVAILLGYWLRAAVLPMVIRFPQSPLPLFRHLDSSFPAGLVIMVVVFSVHGLYTRPFTFWEKTRRLLKAITASFILLATFAFLSRSITRFSRVSLLAAWALSLLLFPLFRSAVRGFLTRRGLCRENVLILGRAASALQAAREIRSHRELGYRIVGFFSPEPEAGEAVPGDANRIPGGFAELEAICRREAIRTIIIIPLDFSRREFIDLVKRCEVLAETIKIVPVTDGLYSMGAEIESLEDLTFISIRSHLFKPWNLALKRGFSLAVALTSGLVLSPFLLLISAAILLDSRGPVFYSQERLGRGERRFRIVKFRSMHLDADGRLAALLRKDPAALAEWNRFRKLRGRDPRVTRVGRFIRKWSLDELPQLFNVIRGDMSLVGPRPYLPGERERIREGARLIFRVDPGITGLWQVSGRNLLTFDDRLRRDEFYIRNWSLWLDTVILLRTVKAIARREGAF